MRKVKGKHGKDSSKKIIIAGLDISKTHYALYAKDETERNIWIVGHTSKTVVNKINSMEVVTKHHIIPSWDSFKRSKSTEDKEYYTRELVNLINYFISIDVSYLFDYFKATKNSTLLYIAIEGYAFHASGQIIQIAEVTGMIKTLFYNTGWNIRIHDPHSIKMWATGNGSAEKIEILKKARKEGVYIPEFLRKHEIGFDIADAFFLQQMLSVELRVRDNPLLIKDLLIEQKRVFNRVTKSNPVNLLSTEFISKYK